MNLNNAVINKKLKVIEIDLNEKVKTRLNQLGVNVGEVISIKRKGLFQSPLMLEIKGYSLAIRKNLAQNIMVKYE